MTQTQEVLDLPSTAIRPASGSPGRTERSLMTFFSVGFALLAIHTFFGYTGLLARAGLLSKSLAKILATIEGKDSEFIAFAVCAIAGLIVAIYRERKPQLAAWEKWDYWTAAIVRYTLAYIFLIYAFAKVFHNQFSTPLSVLDTRLGDVSGFNLTWRFFGYSYAYTLFVASSQIVAAILFMFRRTTTLGAMILLPVIANIVFLNFAYGIPVRMMSSIFLLMTLFLLSQDTRRIKALVWDNRPIGKPTFPTLRKGPRLIALKCIVIAIVIAAPITEMYSAHAAVMKTTTPLAGIWAVQQYTVNGKAIPESDPSAWRRFYVDSDQLAGIRRGQSRAMMFYSPHSMFDSAKHTVDLTRGMGKNKKTFFAGSYDLKQNGTLGIDGHDAKGAVIQVTLTRVKNTGAKD